MAQSNLISLQILIFYLDLSQSALKFKNKKILNVENPIDETFIIKFHSQKYHLLNESEKLRIILINNLINSLIFNNIWETIL